MSDERKLLRIVNSVAPIRICDNGGWSDTWFARYGRVFNIAVYPYAEVQMRVFAHAGERARITINAENYGLRYTIAEPQGNYDKHPLLEAAIDYMHIPSDVAIEVSIHSEAPGGCSTGTSASVSVALIGALDCLTPGRMTAHEIASAAQIIETQLLKQQCGIQDQIASAHGGISFVEMDAYPRATVTAVSLPDPLWWELERRLVLVYLGRSHDSSALHETVIRSLEEAGPGSPALAALRRTAADARDALGNGDFEAFGRAMSDATEGQARLHPALVGTEARRVIEIAKEHGALGWKVNGAGGEGGSLTLLCDEDAARQRALVREVERDSPAFRRVPVRLSREGLRVWRQDFGG
jgi:D-glycero-alpha-D-manno-heptose-7-phosphate kinase